jgi:CheY-like chemotaxis protein
VDDVAEQREIASHMLRKLGYVVLTFASGTPIKKPSLPADFLKPKM